MMTFRDLMDGRLGAKIYCATTGALVRELAVVDNTVDIKASKRRA